VFSIADFFQLHARGRLSKIGIDEIEPREFLQRAFATRFRRCFLGTTFGDRVASMKLRARQEFERGSARLFWG
jgi:hypothetical protein